MPNDSRNGEKFRLNYYCHSTHSDEGSFPRAGETSIFLDVIKWRGSNLLAANFTSFRSAQMKNSKRMGGGGRIGANQGVKGPTLCTNEWSKSAYSRPISTMPVRCSRAFRFWTSRGAFSPFHTRRTNGRIDRPDTTARASFLRARVFFFFGLSPRLPAPPLTRAHETHFYSGQFRRLLLTFHPRGRREGTAPHARAFPAASYAIHFLFYTSFSTSHVYLISCTVNHCDVNYSDFSPQLPRCRAPLYPRSRRSTVSLALQLTKYVTTRLLSCTL